MANPPDPFERFLLKSVDVKNVACPVVDSGANPTKTHFSIGPTRIWQRDVDAPLNRNQPKDQDNQGIPENSDVVPLVVMRNKADLVVKLIIAKDPAGYAKEAGQWHAYLYPEAEEQKNTIVTYMSFAPPLASQDPELSIILPLAIKKLPWEFKGRYKLRIYREGVQFNSLVLETVLNLELYVVVSSLAPFFDRNGIPLSLLRFPGLISSWKTSDLPFWHEYVIKTIFENPHLQYDSYDGKAKYTGLSGWSLLHNQDDQKTTIAMCWLDLFISDLEGLERRNDNTRYAVNCFDLAAISQVFLALGTYPEVIRAVFMKPFGFIKAARFIGNTKEYCNNPIFRGPGYNTSLLCSPTAINRSGFSCHLFLAMDDWADEVIGERRGEITTVLDACCGPQLGRLRIGPQPEEYPSEILDPSKPAGAKSNGVYSLLIGPDGKLIGDPGVKELASSASFNRPTQRIDVQDDARYKMMSHRMLYDDKWATIGDVEQPVISALSGRDFVNATYTVRPKNTVDDDLWTINLARYWFDEDVSQSSFHNPPRIFLLNSRLGNCRWKRYLTSSIGSTGIQAPEDVAGNPLQRGKMGWCSK